MPALRPPAKPTRIAKTCWQTYATIASMIKSGSMRATSERLSTFTARPGNDRLSQAMLGVTFEHLFGARVFTIRNSQPSGSQLVPSRSVRHHPCSIEEIFRHHCAALFARFAVCMPHKSRAQRRFAWIDPCQERAVNLITHDLDLAVTHPASGLPIHWTVALFLQGFAEVIAHAGPAFPTVTFPPLTP